MTDEDDVTARRLKLRNELADWIDARIPEFLLQIEGPDLKLPVVEDFRLLVCINDGADSEAIDYYPLIGSGSSFHRQLGLLVQATQDMEARD